MTKPVSVLRRIFRVEVQKICWIVTLVILVVILALQGIRYRRIGQFEKTLTDVLDQDMQGPSKREARKSQEDYDALPEKGMFGTVKIPPAHSLWGIMGEEALFGPSAEAANPLKVGGKLPSGEEIIHIGINDVVMVKDGKERTVYVHDALKPDGPSNPSGAPSPVPTKDNANQPPSVNPPEARPEPSPDALHVEKNETGQDTATSAEAKRQAAEDAAKEVVQPIRARSREHR